MPLPPLTGLYAGSAGLARLTAPVVRAATGLLVSGRSAVRFRSPAPRSMKVSRLLARDLWNGSWNECPGGDLACPHGEATNWAHRTTPERVVPGFRVRRNRPLTRRPIRLGATAKTETQARIELGKLLEKARDGRSPEADVTMAKLLDEYAPIAQWDVSTRQTNEGFIR